jgi:hypothetical protein
MNILDKEDYVKGAPDEALIQLAQMPTEEIPQFLVVSEIQRREKMRADYAAKQQTPQGTVTDQVIQQGIASLNPNPDPLMNAAMGAPNPMMPQDPMMSQDPMMLQDPMMGQGQTMMAAGGGMMPYRMDGRYGTGKVPYGMDLSKLDPQIEETINALRMQGASEEEIYKMLSSGNMYNQGNTGVSNSYENIINTYAPAPKLSVTEEQVYGSSATLKDAEGLQTGLIPTIIDSGLFEATNAPYTRGDRAVRKNLSPEAEKVMDIFTAGQDLFTDQYDKQVKRASQSTLDPDAMKNTFSKRKALADIIGTGPDLSSFEEKFTELGSQRAARAEERRKEIAQEFEEYETKTKEDTRQDLINTAIIQLGGAIASGQSDFGFSEIGKSLQEIKSRADRELKADRRKSLIDQRQEQRLGEAALQASEDKKLNLSKDIVMSNFNAEVKKAEMLSNLEKDTAAYAMDVFKDERAAERFALQTSFKIDQLAQSLTTSAMAGQRDKELTTRAFINGITDITKEALRNQGTVLDDKQVNRISKDIIIKYGGLFGQVAGRDVEDILRGIIEEDPGSGGQKDPLGIRN